MRRTRIETIGDEAQPLVIFDDFHADPDALRSFAASAPFEPGRQYYPGVRAGLPDSYLARQLPAIGAVVAETFGQAGPVDVIDASFSIVSTAPVVLSVPQRLPHVDAFGGDRIALVHYLSPEGGDGTSFYRHRATGFETVNEERRDLFFRHLDTEIRHGGPPEPAYVNGDTPLFACIHAAEARYNRALLYRSWNLHSGAIAADATLSADPGEGRLTITAFLRVE